MDKESKAQFILNMAKELVLSGKYPIPKRSIVLSGRILLPKIETTKESIEERQSAFLKGYKELVRLLESLYDELVLPSDSRDVSSQLTHQITEQKLKNLQPVVQRVKNQAKKKRNKKK
ncbi:MAG: hypothetical protein L3V56_00580 [Candidatus Magnetoovum sp. WYHC-5]|nr:hypothetical protein [Candidatus Magnetoovum sp. WYHC-5]